MSDKHLNKENLKRAMKNVPSMRIKEMRASFDVERCDAFDNILKERIWMNASHKESQLRNSIIAGGIYWMTPEILKEMRVEVDPYGAQRYYYGNQLLISFCSPLINER